MDEYKKGMMNLPVAMSYIDQLKSIRLLYFDLNGSSPLNQTKQKKIIIKIYNMNYVMLDLI